MLVVQRPEEVQFRCKKELQRFAARLLFDERMRQKKKIGTKVLRLGQQRKLGLGSGRGLTGVSVPGPCH